MSLSAHGEYDPVGRIDECQGKRNRKVGESSGLAEERVHGKYMPPIFKIGDKLRVYDSQNRYSPGRRAGMGLWKRLIQIAEQTSK